MMRDRLALLALGLTTIASIVAAVAMGPGPHAGHGGIDEGAAISGVIAALTVAAIAGAATRGDATSMATINRLIAWPMAFGFVWIHYAYHMQHGQAGGLAALEVVPRAFFLASFSWIVLHAAIAYRLFGAPWRLRVRTVRDVYHLGSWAVLVITIPVFSIPAIGASPVAMALAWAAFAPHLIMNAVYLAGRLPWPLLSRGVGRAALAALYAAAIAVAAVRSFPGS